MVVDELPFGAPARNAHRLVFRKRRFDHAILVGSRHVW